MLCSDLFDYPSDGWLTELTILAKPSSLAWLLDYPKARSLFPDRTGDRSRASSQQNRAVAVCPCILLATLSRGSCRLLSANLETFQRPLSKVFLGMRSQT